MKMFFWNDAYRVPYGSAVVYAVAETEDEARKLAEAAPISEYGYEPRENRHGCDLKGRPADRVIDVPGAEIYQWSE